MVKKIKNYDEESEGDDYYNYRYGDKFELIEKYKLRNSADNYRLYLRKLYSERKPKKQVPENMIIVTENSYVKNYSKGKKAEITKEDLEKYTCLRDEKDKLKKKAQTKDDHLMRFYKAQKDRAIELQKVRDKLKEKDKKLQKYLNIKNKEIKKLENERYQDHQDIHERQQIYEKLLSNYDQKIYYTKEQQKEQNKTINLNKISSETSKKMEELNKQIKDYEKKNDEYKQKIASIFDLKEKDEMDRKIKEWNDKVKKEKREKSMKKENSSTLIKKKFNDLEEKLEIEKYRRENALLTSMDKFQTKINSFLEKKEEKEKKRKDAIIKAEKEKEEKMLSKSNHLDKVKKNIIKVEKDKEKKRLELIDKIEKQNLKDYAIKQEKNKIYEEKRKINIENQKQRQALKLQIQNIIKKEKNLSEGQKTDEIINQLLNSSNNDNQS